MTLANTNVLLGVTGGIAAYKTPDLVRKLVAQGANVRVVLSHSAAEFVSPLSLQAVSGNPVHQHLLDADAEAAMGHIELAKWADVLLIAPATAHCMAKLAYGLADDLLSTLFLATTAKTFIAPAMNQQMWKAHATQHNLSLLLGRGLTILGPAEGEQACGDVGAGRMLEPIDIVSAITHQCGQSQQLAGKRVVVTAGPTREPLDPVRYLSNHSSGKMGFAVASAAQQMGAQVTLISGPVSLPTPQGCSRIDVESANDMLNAALETVSDCDIFIGCAAVADYRAVNISEQKIKKSEQELTLTFTKNPDILGTVASLPSAPFTVGFAAESTDVESYAKDKLKRKKLAMIAANDITIDGLGFNSDQNALHVFWSNGDKKLPPQPKTLLAKELVMLIASRFMEQHSTD